MEKKNIIIFSIVGLAILIVIVLLFIVNPFSADPPAIPQTTLNEEPPMDTSSRTSADDTATEQQQQDEQLSENERSKPEKRISDDVYVVEEGETLKSIAEKVYGDEKMWFKIFMENESTIDWYDTIYVGQKLKLPK